ncbi:hypothetical protein [Stenotrophomonas sp. YIM B06876]|uniref:hypothetical protein n=1 Tax=Stenotrophomonas sp. YIM B06876 TaxID=3060211 RepID=UPI002739C3D0|nr:hypothetical protein [Stenotrophomonas sp. YIM B06876]
MASDPRPDRLILPPWLLGLLQLLGALWTSPNTLLGLVAGLAGMPAGARMQWSCRERALVFRQWPWGPGGAITLGNVILTTGSTLEVRCHTYEHRAGRCRHRLVRLDDHERAHVYQYLVLGPLFLPVYLLCGGVSVRNPFERAADHYALHGHGWWPGRH